MDSTDELLFQVLDRPAAEWSAALEDLCARHGALAEELRKRFALLQGAGLTSPAPDALPLAEADMPEQFGPYRLQRRLGGGGMGVVYLARHEGLGRNVALKLVRPELLYFEGARARFAREVDAVARLEHPGCVQVHQVGEAEGVPYFAMELVAGVSFERVLQVVRARVADSGGLAKLSARVLADALRADNANRVETESNQLFTTTWPRACVQLCLAAAEALAHAHGRGVVHRDVKPSNLMITAEGRVVVIDFGLAVADGASRMTRTGAFLGSLPYMAPEQVRGEVNAVDARTDVYALGVCLYELLTLVSPFDSSNVEATRRRIETGQVTPLRTINSAVDVDVATVCARAMEAHPAQRYQTMHALAADLAAWLDHRPVTARPTSAWRQTVRWARRRPAWAMAVALLLSALVVGPLVVSLAVAGQRDRALAAERLTRRREYSANLVAANMALGVGNSAEALRRLRACPEDLRGFEWRHLERATDPAIVNVKAHAVMITAVAVTRDARWFASGDERGLLAVFDGQTGGRVSDCVAGDQSITALEFSPDGEQLYAVDSAGCLRVFDTQSGRRLRERPRRSLREIIALGDRARSIVCEVDPGRYVDIDPADLSERAAYELSIGDDWPRSVIAVDGDRVAGALSSGGIGLWSLRGGRREQFVLGVAGEKIAAQPDLRRIAVWGEAPLRYWDTDESVLRTLDTGDHRVVCVRFTTDGHHVLAGCVGGEVLVFDLSRSRLVRTLHGTRDVTALAVADHGILVAGARDGRVRVMSVLVDPHVSDLTGVGWGTSLAVDGDRLMTGGRDAVARCFDAHTSELVWQVGLPHWVNGIAAVTDGQIVASVHTRLRLMDRQTGNQRGLIDVPDAGGYALRLAADGAGRRIAWLADVGTLSIIDLAAGQTMSIATVAPNHNDFGGGLAWDLQHDRVLVAGSEPGVVVLDPTTGKVHDRWPTDSTVIAMLVEGDVVWTSEWQRELRRPSVCRRALTDGRLLQRRHVNFAGVFLARLDDRLVVAGGDSLLAVYDIADLELLIHLPLPNESPQALVASTAGDWVAVQCADRDPRVLLGRRDQSANSTPARRRALQAAARTMAVEALAPTLWPPAARRALESRSAMDPELRAAALMALPPDSSWSLASTGRGLSLAVDGGATIRPRLVQYRDALVEALASATDHPHFARSALARVQLRLGDFAAALATLRDFVVADAPYPEDIHFVRSAAYFALGQRGAAEAELAHLRAMVAADDSRSDARRFLREIELHWMRLPGK